MIDYDTDFQNKEAEWQSVGFDTEWTSQKIELQDAISEGIKESVKALEESKKSNPEIIGYRED